MELYGMFSLKKVVILHHSCCILHPDNSLKNNGLCLKCFSWNWVSNDGQRGWIVWWKANQVFFSLKYVLVCVYLCSSLAFVLFFSWMFLQVNVISIIVFVYYWKLHCHFAFLSNIKSFFFLYVFKTCHYYNLHIKQCH